jgi:signal recognition particle receptor subunit beta
MVFDGSDPHPPGLSVSAVKILIAGGFGVGKTTMVASVSEIPPLRTEELITEMSRDVDDLTGVERKITTTVALDFGRITVDPQLVAYLFGTPGQDRFWFLWNELALGAIGAVVLADTRRLDSCFPAVDFFESRDIPFVIGVNCFDGSQLYTLEEVRQALDLTDVPMALCDVRDRQSCKQVLLLLAEHALALAAGAPGRPRSVVR